jgi:hypothetical protein
MHVLLRSRQAPCLLQQSINRDLGTVCPRSLTPCILEKHTVPFSLKGVPAIDYFVERASDMQKLDEYFFHQQPHLTRRKMFVVHGLGGIGKTQLCIEFVRRYQERYSAVFWLDGSSEYALQHSFVDVLERLPPNEVPLSLNQSAEQTDLARQLMVKAVLDWLSLSTNQQWLIVIDNADHDHTTHERDPSAYDIKKYIPAADHGNIIVTSRLSTLAIFKNSLRLSEVNHDQGRAILAAFCGETISGTIALFQRLFNKQTDQSMWTLSGRGSQREYTLGKAKWPSPCFDTGRGLHPPDRCKRCPVSGVL